MYSDMLDSSVDYLYIEIGSKPAAMYRQSTIPGFVMVVVVVVISISPFTAELTEAWFVG